MSVNQLPYRVSSLVKKTCSPLFQQCIRHDSAKFSTTSTYEKDKSYKLVVVGGGTGGCATAAMFSRKLGPGSVAVIEPSDVSIGLRAFYYGKKRQTCFCFLQKSMNDGNYI